MLPIEKGCRAIVIKSDAGNTGKEVVVGNYIGNPDGLYEKTIFIGKDWWEIEEALTFDNGKKYRIFPEHRLMRIDGHKEETKQKEEVVR